MKQQGALSQEMRTLADVVISILPAILLCALAVLGIGGLDVLLYWTSTFGHRLQPYLPVALSSQRQSLVCCLYFTAFTTAVAATKTKLIHYQKNETRKPLA